MTTIPPFRPKANAPSRTAFLAGLLIAGLAVLEWRLIHLQVLRHEELEEKAEKYRFASRVEQSWRGQICDRTGIPLALTVPAKNLYADLSVWTNRVGLLARIVAPLLETDPAGLAQLVQQRLSVRDGSPPNHGPGVLLVKRGVTPMEWTTIKEALACQAFGFQTNQLSSRQRKQLKSLRRWTLFAEDDQRRFCPYGGTLAATLGFVGTGTNGHLLQGKWGVEAKLDFLLAGKNGDLASSQDAAGNELAFCRTTNLTVHDGTHVGLTIDLALQKIVEDALARVVSRYNPSNASCVVVRPSTGEILALASLPTFSPEQPGRSPAANWLNHAISDRNEVGSVFKVITLAAALELGVVNLDTHINCENGSWVYKKSTLHDDGHRNGSLTVRECLAKSSNIGLAKLAVMVGTNGLYDTITKFGLDRATGVPLPYETSGLVHPLAKWSPSSITHVAIGHELSISQLQLVMAYAAIANDGKLMRPMLVSQLNHADGRLWGRYQPTFVRAVVRPETARLVREAMRDVVEHGTGKLAALPEHSTCGKTGTAQKSDGHRYVPGRLYCSFIGMVPAGKPELVIAVAVDEPKDSAYGGTVAAPVFREIAEQAVVLYGIAPDKGLGSPRRPAPSGNPLSTHDLIAMRQ